MTAVRVEQARLVKRHMATLSVSEWAACGIVAKNEGGVSQQAIYMALRREKKRPAYLKVVGTPTTPTPAPKIDLDTVLALHKAGHLNPEMKLMELIELLGL